MSWYTKATTKEAEREIPRDAAGPTLTDVALRASEVRYREIVESAQDPIFIADREGRYVYVNRAAAATFGRQPEEIIGLTVDDLFPPHMAEQYRTAVSQVIETGETLVSENLSEINGEPLWFSNILQPVRDDEGRVEGVQGVIRDITAIKQVEESLRESEGRLLQVVRVAHIGIFDHDHRTGTIHWSPEQQAIYGWQPGEQVSGDDFRSNEGSLPAYLALVHPDDRTRVTEAVRRAHGPGDGLFDIEHRIIRRDGSVRWLTTRSQTFFEGEEGDRHPVRTVGAVQDITGRKQAEEAQQRLQTQLVQSQKMEVVGQLAGGIAHDFNNLLQGMAGYMELLLDDTPEGSSQREDVQQVRELVERATRLTKQLLAFSRQQPTHPQVVDWHDHLRGSVEFLERVLGKNVQLHIEPDPGSGCVRADVGHLDQVLMNLAVNARDAMPDGGRLTLWTSTTRTTHPTASGLPGETSAEYVTLSVRDTGCGMDQATRAHLFEPFFTTKGVGKGTGLGLSTVYGIVQQHGGFIDVQSQVGEGTTVMVGLPRIAADATGTETVSNTVAAGSARETVLVVDDDPVVLKINRALLERLGYAVLSANGAEEAIRLVEGHVMPIDLLMTDVRMPGMNGRDLAKRLTSEAPTLKCLFVSGYSDGSLDGALEPGLHTLGKPFSLNQLAARVREVLDATE